MPAKLHEEFVFSSKGWMDRSSFGFHTIRSEWMLQDDAFKFIFLPILNPSVILGASSVIWTPKSTHSYFVCGSSYHSTLYSLSHWQRLPVLGTQ